MNTTFSKQRNLLGAIGLAICFSILTTSCTSGVSQEEYDQLKSQLAQVSTELEQTKAELAKVQEEATAAQKALQEPLEPVRASWESVQPLVQIALLRIENQTDWHVREAGDITPSEYYRRATKLWAKIDACLGEIGNEDFADKLEAAWFGGGDKHRLWDEANSLHLSLAEEALGEFSNKLGK